MVLLFLFPESGTPFQNFAYHSGQDRRALAEMLVMLLLSI
jgi:hypothetical protein